MSQTFGIAAGMPVVAADGRAVGYVTRIGSDQLGLTCVKDGRGFDHIIPLAWVEAVDRYVFLSRASAYVEAHRRSIGPEMSIPRPIAA